MKLITQTTTRSNVVLAVLSGILLGVSFPPSPLYSLAYVALIPLIYLLDRMENAKQVIRYSYLAMFVFHVLTLYWVGGFTHGSDPYLMAAGTALLIAHPMFYWLPILAYWWVKNRVGGLAALLAFPFFWITYEYSHSLSEFSFPWIALGNSQANEVYRIQMAEFTSVYGLSFVILCFNVFAYWLLVQFITRKGKLSLRFLLGSGLVLFLFYFGPWIYGWVVIESQEATPSGVPVKTGIIQPNVDPWDKWGEGWGSKWESYHRQFNLLLPTLEQRRDDSLDLLVWPETAIPFHVLLPQNRPYLEQIREGIRSSGVSLFTGIPYAEFFDPGNAPVTARRAADGERLVEYYNSATLFSPMESTSVVHKKVVLVPFAERVPYAETLTFLVEPLKWNVGISGWGKGKDLVIFAMQTRRGETVRFSGMICYESVYPNFVRRFVKNGAEFIIIVTNDSWWGNTSGAYQHAAYASLRAVENRRWIVRSANGGISAFVDPWGRRYLQTKMYASADIAHPIYARDDETFYARHGDVFALVCAGLSGGIILLTLVFRRKRGVDVEC